MQQQFWLTSYSNHRQIILKDTQMNELPIEDLVVGAGKTCVKGALITAHYTGGLIWIKWGVWHDAWTVIV